MAGLTIQALKRKAPAGERDDEQPDAHPGSQAQRRSLVRTAGRVILWLFIALVIVRGLGAIFGSDKPAPATRATTPAEQRFPDQEARTFAGQFAKSYLSFRPGGEESYAARIAPYLASSVRDSATLQLAERGASQGATDVSVARVQTVGDAQALVTVAVNVTRITPGRTIRVGKGTRRRTRTIPTRQASTIDYLSVPVYRDKRGGLSVYDLPSFTAPPARAADFDSEPSQLQGSSTDTGAINDLVRKFLAVYLGGRPDQLNFYTPPATRITPLGRDLTLRRVEQVQQVGDSAGHTRRLLVQALIRDPTTRTVYPMRYRLDVVRRDRWLVRGVDGGGGPQ